jgi:DNA-damage-inducible protein D
MSDLTLYEQEPKPLNFEDFRHENGIVFWWASDLMVMLGYKDMMAFQKVLDRTTKAFVSLGIPHYQNIIAFEREMDGKTQTDFKLTRFACYMTAMNADPKRTEVALAQAYFAQQTRRFEVHLQNGNDLDRLVFREELKEGNQSLCRTAQSAGLENFASFQDAGYLGLYNMRSAALKMRRNTKDLFDHMGRTELAANLFRVTQTEERINSRGVRGQRKLEDTHFTVGKEVRDMVVRNSGRTPENLEQERQLPEVKKELKQGYRKMSKEEKKH